MKKYKSTSIIVVLLVLVQCSPVSASRRSLGVGSPTVPPSRYGNSLHRSTTYSQSRLRNEAAITGNIAGGSHFKGSVPYRSSYEFQGPSATSTINSFLRYSSQPSYNRNRSTDVTPYYLPSRTVSTLRRNGVSGYKPPIMDYAGQADRFKHVYQSNITTADINPTLRYRPLSINLTTLELQVLREARESNFDYRDMRQFLNNDAIRDILTGVRDVDLKDMPSEESETVESNPLFTSVEPLEPVVPVEPIVPGERGTVEEEFKFFEDRMKEPDIEIVPAEDEAEETEDGAEEEKDAEDESHAKKFSDSMLAKIDHETARGILGRHKTFKEYAAAKYSDYMGIGDAHLKAGKFYKAADAYTLANIYNSGMPGADGGKGLALFAAGEYLTSAGYVEKAVEISPEYASKKIDLAGILDEETLDKRLANLEGWYETNHSPRFIFLASYIYYHRGDFEKASESLDKAAVKMQGRPSFDAMRKAIDKAIEAAIK